MCCSAWPVEFSRTITGVWEVLVDEKIQHVIWYQNKVVHGWDENLFQSLVSESTSAGGLMKALLPKKAPDSMKKEVVAEIEWRRNGNDARTLEQVRSNRGGGNCLIIPLLGSWESIKLLNTAQTPQLLTDIDTALELPTPEALSLRSSLSNTGGVSNDDGSKIVFLKFDVYDIVLAQRASRIATVLPQIQSDKRPTVNDDVFRLLEEWYNCPVAVCCFNPMQEAESKPIGFAFEPTFPDVLRVYTLDGHDGKPPDPDANAFLDHTIFVGSFMTPSDSSMLIEYKDAIPAHLRPYVLDQAMGLPIQDRMINGDIVFDVDAVRKGWFDGRRELPPFAPTRSMQKRVVRGQAYKNGRSSHYATA
jgi:hypothetical protein